ncbi:hypothetical protein D3C85_948570 [compost metagenome]
MQMGEAIWLNQLLQRSTVRHATERFWTRAIADGFVHVPYDQTAGSGIAAYEQEE